MAPLEAFLLAVVEQAAAASESMDEQSQGLGRLMENFNTGEQDGIRVAAPSPSQAQRAAAGQAAAAAKPSPRRAAAPGADDEWEEF